MGSHLRISSCTAAAGAAFEISQPVARGRCVTNTFLKEEMWSCTRDEGRPLEVRSQVPASNLCKLRPSRAAVGRHPDMTTPFQRVMRAGVSFGTVLAATGYGISAPSRQALTALTLLWTVGTVRIQKVYPADVHRERLHELRSWPKPGHPHSRSGEEIWNPPGLVQSPLQPKRRACHNRSNPFASSIKSGARPLRAIQQVVAAIPPARSGRHIDVFE
jgi:hypothetical protein